MNIDTYALVAAVIGIVCGRYFTSRNSRFLKHAMYSLRFMLDKQYLLSLYRKLQSYDYYISTNSTFDYLPYDQHSNALERSLPKIYDSLVAEYIVVGRELLFHFIRLFTLPAVLFILVGQITAFLAASLITIVVALWYETYIANGSAFIAHAQYTILLRHAYCMATEASTNTQLSSTTMSSESRDDIYPDVYSGPLHGAEDIEPANEEKPMHISWQRLWWGNDIALCVMLGVMYVLLSSGSASESLLGTIQLVLFVQLFFVPMWGVITLAIKLLSKYD